MKIHQSFGHMLLPSLIFSAVTLAQNRNPQRPSAPGPQNSTPRSTAPRTNAPIHKLINSLAEGTNSVFIAQSPPAKNNANKTAPNIGNRYGTPYYNVVPGIGNNAPQYPPQREGSRTTTGLPFRSTTQEKGPENYTPSDDDYGEPRIIQKGSVTARPNRKSLCSVCLCDSDRKNIVCEHRHIISEEKHEITLGKESFPPQVEYIRMTGYEDVFINPGTFANESSKITKIVFENIKNIHLQKHSLLFSSWARNNIQVEVQFRKCGIEKFPTEALTQLEDSHGRQGRVELENTRFISFEFYKCNIGTLEERSLYHARMTYFTILDSEIRNIKPKAIDLDVYELCKIKKTKLPTLVTGAMCFHAKKTVISSNDMTDLRNNSIVIETDGQVLFEYNNVVNLHAGALAGIKPKKGVYGASIVFLTNSLQWAEANSLYIDPEFPSHERKVLNNTFNIKCMCNISTKFEKMMGINTAQSYDPSALKGVVESSQCHEIESNSFLNVEKFLADECTPFPLVTVCAVTAAILLFVIAVTVCVVCSLKVQQVKEEANVLGECTSQSFSTLPTLPRNFADMDDPYKYPTACQSPCQLNCQSPIFNMTQWVAAVPEVRTYQQTTVQDFNERTESICGTIRDSKLQIEGRVLARGSCPFN